MQGVGSEFFIFFIFFPFYWWNSLADRLACLGYLQEIWLACHAEGILGWPHDITRGNFSALSPVIFVFLPTCKQKTRPVAHMLRRNRHDSTHKPEADHIESEPMFTGFVGHNFLSAAVSGSVFASPTGRQIYEAIKLCQSSPSSRAHGSLLVVGNYTGDILNAGLAITRATAAGYNVRLVAVGDDIAVGRKKGGKVGRRGLSGHLLGLKCACALAARGTGLDEVAVAVERVVERVGTIGCAFDR